MDNLLSEIHKPYCGEADNWYYAFSQDPQPADDKVVESSVKLAPLAHEHEELLKKVLCESPTFHF